MVPASVPGIEEMNAVDAAGVHPLLLAIGRERYQPYIQNREPMELLKEANALLGFNQVSLSKYLFIAAREDAPNLHTKEVVSYFIHILERIQFHRDVHFQTETTIDTLDYSGRSLNHGSKVIFAAAGEKIRTLGNSEEEFSSLHLPEGFSNPKMAFPGALVIQAKPSADMHALTRAISSFSCREKFPLITIADDSHFAAKNIDNWLWVTFTRSDPAADIYGANENIQQKHWQCDAPLLIDARMKSQMQKPVEEDAKIESLARDILFRAQKKASR